MSDLKTHEMTQRKQTDIRHTEHDLCQLAVDGKLCVPHQGLSVSSESIIICAEHALIFILLLHISHSKIRKPPKTIFDTTIALHVNAHITFRKL